jgi:hypothetical protein
LAEPFCFSSCFVNRQIHNQKDNRVAQHFKPPGNYRKNDALPKLM